MREAAGVELTDTFFFLSLETYDNPPNVSETFLRRTSCSFFSLDSEKAEVVTTTGRSKQ